MKRERDYNQIIDLPFSYQKIIDLYLFIKKLIIINELPIDILNYITLTIISNIGDTPLISCAFQKEWIDYMIDHRYKLQGDVKHLFISIDPASGKDKCMYAITSTIFIVENDAVDKYKNVKKCVVCLFIHSSFFSFLSISISL
jgi:hypothetical protein